MLSVMAFPSPFLAIFDLGGTEIMVILVVVLIFFGGDKLPEVARGLGKSIREFKKATAGIEEEFKRAMEEPPKRVAKPAPSGKIVLNTAGQNPVPPPAGHLEPAPDDPSTFEHGEN